MVYAHYISIHIHRCIICVQSGHSERFLDDCGILNWSGGKLTMNYLVGRRLHDTVREWDGLCYKG